MLLLAVPERLARSLLLGLGLSALGDILDDGNKVSGFPRVLTQQRDGQVDPHDLPVFAVVALLHRVTIRLPGQEPFNVLEIGFQVVGVGDILESKVLNLLLRVAHDIAELSVKLDGRKSRCRLVTTMTNRSNHMPTFTRITTGYISNADRRIFLNHSNWGTSTLQVTMVQ